MTFGEAIRRCLRRYAGFRGQASRAEFWRWIAAVAAVWLVLLAAWAVKAIALDLAYVLDKGSLGPLWVVDLVGEAITVSVLVGVLAFLPTAAAARRLHDTGRSGWMMLVWFAAPIPGWFAAGNVVWGLWVASWGGADPSPVPLLIVLALALVVTIAMVVWAVASLSRPGDPFPNQHGQPQG